MTDPPAHLPTAEQVHDAQQYMFHSGHPPLLQWARSVASACHAPPCITETVITSGAVRVCVRTHVCVCVCVHVRV